MSEKRTNPFAQYFSLWFPLLTALMTFWGGYKLLVYRVEVLETKMGNPMSMDDVRKVVKDELIQMNERLSDYIHLDEENSRMRIQLYQKLNDRVTLVEKALYKRGML